MTEEEKTERNRQYAKNRHERLKNDPEYRAYRRKYKSDAKKKNWRGRLLKGARARAKEHGLPYSVSTKDLTLPSECPIFGTPINYSLEGGPYQDGPSIDRVVPELGYVAGNVVIVSNRANRLKSNGTIADFESILRYMREHGQA